MTLFKANDVSILTPCLDEAVHTYATSSELNKESICLNSPKINEAVVMKLPCSL